MRALLLASVAILGIVWSECASASLLGDTFNETANLTFGKTTEVVANNGNSKVNPTATFYGQPNQITTTISATGISLVSGSVTTTFSAYTFNGFVLTDLTNSDISGVTLLSSSVPGFTANDLTATSDTISVNLAGLIVGANESIVAAVSTNTPTAVPEPASMALLGMGALSTLAVARRRRRGVDAG